MSELKSAVSSLKEVVTIITAVTVANATAVFLTEGDYKNLLTADRLRWLPLCLYGLLILNLVRFYHGNIRLLDDTYDPPGAASPKRKQTFALDFAVIFLTAVIFCVTGFYIYQIEHYFALFVFLLVVDVVWLFATRVLGTQRDEKIFFWWMINNFVCGLGMAVLCSFAIAFRVQGQTIPQWVVALLTSLLFANSAIDFWVSRSFYFPKSIPTSDPKKQVH